MKNQNVFQCPSNFRKDLPQFSDDGSRVGFTSYAANYHGGIRDVNANQPVLTLASLVGPSNTINIVETTATYSDYQVDFGAGSTFGTYTTSPTDGRGCVFAGHTGFSNYLFADGHVKAMRPLATLSTVDNGTGTDTLWLYDNDTFVHHQAGTGAPEPNPTRAASTLMVSVTNFK